MDVEVTVTEVDFSAMTIGQKLAALAKLIGGNAWGADKGKPRIYMNVGRRDVKCYFDFPDAGAFGENDLGGDALMVFIDDCGQHPNWYAGQKRKIVDGQHRNGLALMAANSLGDFALARAILDQDGDLTDHQINAFAHEAINGRRDIAAAILGL